MDNERMEELEKRCRERLGCTDDRGGQGVLRIFSLGV